MDGMQGLIGYVMEFTGVPDEIITAFSSIDLWDAGVSLIQSLWGGMGSLMGKMVGALKAKLAGILPDWVKRGWEWAKGVGKAAGQYLPGRDRGGPVRAGQPYLVGERAPELFVPGVSGSILPTRALKAAMAASAISAPAMAAPSQFEVAQTIDTRRVIASAAPSPTITREGNTYNITITPSHGMDEAALARLVAQELDRREDRSANLYDGEAF
ncbi:MAG: hypothetical protein ACPGVK_08310 [Halocynthiibacter sp.]